MSVVILRETAHILTDKITSHADHKINVGFYTQDMLETSGQHKVDRLRSLLVNNHFRGVTFKVTHMANVNT